MIAFIRSRAALTLSLFLLVWGVKLTVIDRFGSDLAFWDQWAAEGELLYAPWLERGEFWSNLLVPHNEHRIAPTRLMDLVFVALSGQWDSRVQCIASAALHAAIAAGLLLWATRWLPRGWTMAAAGLLAVVAGCCIARDNVLTGFQSQFFFLAGFSFLALGGLLATPALSPRWWGGFIAGLLALVSMGSGLLFTLPLLAVAGARLFVPATRRDAITTIAAGIVLVGLGLWLRTPAPWHDTLRAGGLTLLAYAARCLAWPLHAHAWFALIVWAPWLVLVIQRIRTLRSAAEPAGDFVLAGGGWVLLQTLAVSYSRGGAGGYPATRYGDVFAFGIVFGLFALALLSRNGSRARQVALGGGWLLAVTAAIALAARPVWRDAFPQEKADRVAYEQNVQAFVLTDDFATFEKQKLPFPLPDWLARILRRPSLRAILPASVRAPLPIKELGDHAVTLAGPLAHRATRALLQPGEWRSVALPAGGGWWKIETAGHIGELGVTLRLVSAANGRLLEMIAPSKPAGNSWRAAYVRAPEEPALLVARVDDPGRWLAFSEPVEISALSHTGWQLAKHGHWLAGLGAGGLLLAAGAGRRADKTLSRPAVPRHSPIP